MTALSLALSKAVSRGRRDPQPVATRERLLVTLLRKRATARNVGDVELESMLRSQILWSLPTFDRADLSCPEDALQDAA